MKQRTIIIALLFHLSYLSLLSQGKHICNLSNSNFEESYEIPAIDSFTNNQEAVLYISKLMEALNFPMNFKIYECSQINCSSKNNAYAVMDINARRYIVYDNAWFNTLNNDSTKIESLTILSHEIGHHLSAHTLYLNYLNNEDAIKYCDPNKKSFDKSICEKNYFSDYLDYLKKSRSQELEADRISGFIMGLYGAKLDNVLSAFKKISSNYNDTLSTHPKLSKRIKAVKEGWNLAIQKIENNISNYDLQEIKGTKIDFEITNLSKIERNKLVAKLGYSMVGIPMNYVRKNAKLSFGSGAKGIENKIMNRLFTYHGYKDNVWEVDIENEYFRCWSQYLYYLHDKSINYTPYPAIHIKNGLLKILIFESEVPRVVYSSKFDEEDISFKEIESIFIELYKNGIDNQIKKYNEK